MVQFQKEPRTIERLTIGTRGSPLARAQAFIVQERLREVSPDREIVQKIIATSGDRDQSTPLTAIGGKGIFIRELEKALLEGAIDVAVHSLKDVTTRLADGLRLSAVFASGSPCDVLVLRAGLTFDELPPASRIGTGSMRRKALLSRLRPELALVDIRGNIDTRLRKMEEGNYEGVLLSEAGLLRLGLAQHIAYRFPPEKFYPAPGQGVIALETRSCDARSHEICVQAGDEDQRIISEAELSLLRTVGFDCRAPLGVYTQIDGSALFMKGFIVHASSGTFIEREASGLSSDPIAVGRNLGKKFL